MASFDELQALAEAIDRNKIKNLEFIGADRRRNTLSNRFYEGLLDGRFQNDEQARRALYGEQGGEAAYAKMKARLYQKLKNTLLLTDTSQANLTTYQDVYYQCFRDFAVVKTLLRKHIRPAAISLAKRTLKTALKHEITEVTLEMARILRLHSGNVQGDMREFKKYDQLVNKYAAIYEAEIGAEKHFGFLMSHYVNSASSKNEFLEYSSECLKELRKTRKTIHSLRFDLLFFSISLIHHEIQPDYQGVIKVCRKALDYFERKQSTNNNVFYHFHLRLLASFIIQGKFPAAEREALTCIELQPVGSANWYYSLNFHLILSFHAHRYGKAYQVYRQAISHPNFRRQYPVISETWRIHEAFIHYFIAVGKIRPPEEDKLKRFRLSRFLNQVPVFSRDKRGANINILLLQVLFLLHQRRHDVIVDRMEALSAYAHRYLRRDDTFRSNCFIKMLLQLPAGRFTRAGVERRADKYWKKLLSLPLSKSNQSTELEIVPYETLWALVLESLDGPVR